MSDLEKWPRPINGDIIIDVEVEDGTKFFVYCDNCKKSLYYATENNPITQRVAEETMVRHATSYHPIHRVVIVLNEEGTPEISSQPGGQ